MASVSNLAHVENELLAADLHHAARSRSTALHGKQIRSTVSPPGQSNPLSMERSGKVSAVDGIGHQNRGGPNQRRYCDRHRDLVVQRSPLVIARFPCGNFHHSVEDYRWWARLLAACLRRSWAEQPPDATFRVTAFGLGEQAITKVENKFLGRLRRRGMSYAWFREWQAPEQGRHLHLVVRAVGSKVDLDDVGELWRRSLGDAGNGTTYAASIHNLNGLARYLTGDCTKVIVLPPPEVRYIYGADRGFLVRPLAALKREVRAEWARMQYRCVASEIGE